jgi:hypothetical protein
MLYFIYFINRMHFIYHLLRIKKQYLFLYFEYVINYIERRYSLKVKIFYKDKELIV